MQRDFGSEWKEFWRDAKYERVRMSIIAGSVLFVALTWFVSRAMLPESVTVKSPARATVPDVSNSGETEQKRLTVYVTRTGQKYHRGS